MRDQLRVQDIVQVNFSLPAAGTESRMTTLHSPPPAPGSVSAVADGTRVRDRTAAANGASATVHSREVRITGDTFRYGAPGEARIPQGCRRTESRRHNLQVPAERSARASWANLHAGGEARRHPQLDHDRRHLTPDRPYAEVEQLGDLLVPAALAEQVCHQPLAGRQVGFPGRRAGREAARRTAPT